MARRRNKKRKLRKKSVRQKSRARRKLKKKPARRGQVRKIRATKRQIRKRVTKRKVRRKTKTGFFFERQNERRVMIFILAMFAAATVIYANASPTGFAVQTVVNDAEIYKSVGESGGTGTLIAYDISSLTGTIEVSYRYYYRGGTNNKDAYVYAKVDGTTVDTKAFKTPRGTTASDKTKYSDAYTFTLSQTGDELKFNYKNGDWRLSITDIIITEDDTIPATETSCTNGVDDDSDGLIDCADSDCSSDAACVSSVCGDGTCDTNETSSTCSADCGASINCTDTDGGKDYYTKGKVINETNEESIDYCNFNLTNPLVEFYCTADGEDEHEAYVCPDGCEDGACIAEEPTTTCTDTDGGKDYYTKGIKTNETGTFTDNCWNDRLQEFYCLDDFGEVQEYYYCPNDCEDGACVEEEETLECIADSDCDSGLECIDNWCLPPEDEICEENEKQCSGNDLQICFDNDWGTLQVCENGCDSGELKCNIQTSQICTDSDGGSIYDVKGVSYGIDKFSGAYITRTDECSDSVVIEYYCIGYNIDSTVSVCEYGCKDGACVSAGEELTKEAKQTRQRVDDWLGWAWETYSGLIEGVIDFFGELTG